MARVFAAFADGWGRVLRAPAILLGVFAVTWLVAFPAGRLLDQSVRAPALSRTDASDALAGGFDRTFTPTLLGADRFVVGVRGFLADGTLPVELVAAAATTLLVWTFLLGGILDRYARRRPIRAQAFFGASGVFFFRFLRLGVVASAGYALLFGLVHPLIFLPSYRWVTSDAAAGDRGRPSPGVPPLCRLPRRGGILERGGRLRPHPRRRRGPPQHAGRVPGGLAVRRPATR